MRCVDERSCVCARRASVPLAAATHRRPPLQPPARTRARDARRIARRLRTDKCCVHMRPAACVHMPPRLAVCRSTCGCKRLQRPATCPACTSWTLAAPTCRARCGGGGNASPQLPRACMCIVARPAAGRSRCAMCCTVCSAAAAACCAAINLFATHRLTCSPTATTLVSRASTPGQPTASVTRARCTQPPCCRLCALLTASSLALGRPLLPPMLLLLRHLVCRPHLFQPSAHVSQAHPPDCGGAWQLHRWRRIRAGELPPRPHTAALLLRLIMHSASTHVRAAAV